MKNRNQFRSPAFLKVKQNIQSSTNYGHLESCERMIDCATPILTGDEIIILQEYLLTARNLFAPIEMIHEQLKQATA